MDSIYIMRNFFAAVINKAIADWVKHPVLCGEIREFFASEWGKGICDFLDLPVKDILHKLENGEINYHILDEEAE